MRLQGLKKRLGVVMLVSVVTIGALYGLGMRSVSPHPWLPLRTVTSSISPASQLHLRDIRGQTSVTGQASQTSVTQAGQQEAGLNGSDVLVGRRVHPLRQKTFARAMASTSITNITTGVGHHTDENQQPRTVLESGESKTESQRLGQSGHLKTSNQGTHTPNQGRQSPSQGTKTPIIDTHKPSQGTNATSQDTQAPSKVIGSKASSQAKESHISSIDKTLHTSNQPKELQTSSQAKASQTASAYKVSQPSNTDKEYQAASAQDKVLQTTNKDKQSKTYGKENYPQTYGQEKESQSYSQGKGLQKSSQRTEPQNPGRNRESQTNGDSWTNSVIHRRLSSSVVDSPHAGGHNLQPLFNKNAIENLTDLVKNVVLDNIPFTEQPQASSDTSDIDPRLLVSRTTVSEVGGQVCPAHHHVAFLKVHKAASSTVANILQRYGFTQRLNFALPNKRPKTGGYNYISKPGARIGSSSILPLPPGRHYDILWSHAIYNRTAFETFMPPDTAYVAILREPFQQFVSAYAFYSPGSLRNTSTSDNPFSVYLHKLSKQERLQPMDYYRNKQSQDVGMTPQHALNAKSRHEYLRQLSGELNLVMMTEFFDESLVLLRRLLCWSVKDVLYLVKNKNANKPSLTFTAQDYAQHRQLAQMDYDLYDFFRKKFLRTLEAQDVDFAQEVQHFKDVLPQVSSFCEKKAKTARVNLFVPRSPWSEEFTVSREDCLLLAMSELAFLDVLLAAHKLQGGLLTEATVPGMTQHGTVADHSAFVRHGPDNNSRTKKEEKNKTKTN